MPRSIKHPAAQHLHNEWTHEVLDKFIASGSPGTPPAIHVEIGTTFEGKYKERRNELHMKTTPSATKEEVTGLTAHELGHWARRDVQRPYYFRFWLEVAFSFLLTAAFYYAPNYFELPTALRSGSVLVAATGICIAARWSRKAEYDADRTAASIVDSGPLLAMLDTSDWLNRHVAFIHPRTEDRIQALPADPA
ncbi:M48 family metalloprotease [Rhodococcus qingshengii]|uniref:M48 family metalloprotease n=1 Tax=Rhodococcus qingshengii TaxID=334542 RepID=UPI001A3D1BDC|nr:M48 family metalloprotease [Rhodococcus qingshengii]ULD38924.1 M48 family metalloprotease [Rhodococcus qingshengii]